MEKQVYTTSEVKEELMTQRIKEVLNRTSGKTIVFDYMDKFDYKEMILTSNKCKITLKKKFEEYYDNF
jgi:hypothetical protein